MPDLSLKTSDSHGASLSHSPTLPSSTNQSPLVNQTTDAQLQATVRKLAHDLRTPLSIMAMGIEAIRSMKGDPAQCDALCEMMAREGVGAMKRLIEQVVDRTGR